MEPKGARLDPSEHKENRLRDPPEDPQNPFFLERGGALRALNARFPDQVEQPQNNYAFCRGFRAGSPLFKFAAVFCPFRTASRPKRTQQDE